MISSLVQRAGCAEIFNLGRVAWLVAGFFKNLEEMRILFLLLGCKIKNLVWLVVENLR
jgi:hypothetical protein